MDIEIANYIEQIKKEPNVVEKARLMHFLNQEKDLKIKDIARLLNTSSATICNTIRILRVPEIVVDGYLAKQISFTHLLIVSRLADPAIMTSVYETILTDNLTTLETDERVRELLYGVKTEGEVLSKDDKRELANHFKKIDSNFDVDIVQTRIKAAITVTIKGSLAKTTSTVRKLSEKNERQ